MKILSPRVHGYIDYAAAVMLFLAPTLFGFGGVPATICYVLGALLIKLIFPIGVTRSISLGTPTLANNVQIGQAIALETVLTFFLVSAVFGTCVNAEAPKVGGFGVGLVLWFDILVGGPVTGAAMNPARAFGPALVAGQWVAHIVYWVGPLLGGIVAALLWEYVLLPPRVRG